MKKSTGELKSHLCVCGDIERLSLACPIDAMELYAFALCLSQPDSV